MLGLVCYSYRRDLFVLNMCFVYYLGKLIHCCCAGEYLDNAMDGYALVYVNDSHGVITNEDPSFPMTISQSSLGQGQKGVVLVKHCDVWLDVKGEKYRYFVLFYFIVIFFNN